MNKNFDTLKKWLTLGELARAPLASNAPANLAAAHYMEAAQQLLWYFQTQEELDSLQMTCVLTTEVVKEPATIRATHHVKLVATGADLGLQDTDAVNAFVNQFVPFESMGNGSVKLSRNDPVVQQYLATSHEDSEALMGLVYRLAFRLHASFSSLALIHDVA